MDQILRMEIIMNQNVQAAQHMICMLSLPLAGQIWVFSVLGVNNDIKLSLELELNQINIA